MVRRKLHFGIFPTPPPSRFDCTFPHTVGTACNSDKILILGDSMIGLTMTRANHQFANSWGLFWCLVGNATKYLQYEASHWS